MAQVSAGVEHAQMPEHILQVGNAHLEPWGATDTLHAVGKAVPKQSGVDKVTGRARYAFDVQIPGVRTILTPANFPTLASQGRPALSDQVRFVGEEIAAVAADTEQTAHAAVRAITVKYEKYPAVIEPEAAMQPFAPALTPQGNIGGGRPEVYERGNIQQGEAAA